MYYYFFLGKEIKIFSSISDESTRVCLQPIRGVDGSDYINASFIDVSIEAKTDIHTMNGERITFRAESSLPMEQIMLQLDLNIPSIE